MSQPELAVQPLSEQNFDEAVAEHDFLVINFVAKWCSPCRIFRTVLTDAAGKHRDVSFAVVDIEDEPELSAAFGVESIPTIVVIRGGAVVFSHPGALSDAALADVIRQVHALDMAAVRQAAAQAS